MDPRDLQLLDRHFEIHGDKFEYANVKSLRWQTSEIIRSIYFIPVGVHYTYELLIQFLVGAPLQLGAGSFPSAFSRLSPTLSKSDFRELSTKVKQLHAATHETRLAQYQKELQNSGCFEYDEKVFFADGSVEYKGRRRTIDFATPAKAGATHTELRCLPSGMIEVSTSWDRDCFHALLSQMHKARAGT